MDVFLGLLIGVLQEGFVYGIMALGIYITYQVLNFPDLTVEGTFPLGSCVAGVMIASGINPWLACLAAFVAGAAAGAVTGLLHVKLHITDLLSGILVMTALWSANLAVTSGSAVVPFYNQPTIYTSGLAALIPDSHNSLRALVVAFVSCMIVKVLLDLYLKTKSGLLLRAAGNNPRYVVALGKDPGNMKILGLMLGNGLASLSGCILCQREESADIYSGTGMIVLGLAAVIVGVNIFAGIKFLRPTTAVAFGAILYRGVLVGALQMGLPTNYMKLLMAVLLTIVLVVYKAAPMGRGKKYVNRTQV
ncbi:MAG: hypothetical protein ACFWTN_10235 [Clostridium sp.]|jgi:putative tryptophan/tyrosine transport system permease protein